MGAQYSQERLLLFLFLGLKFLLDLDADGREDELEGFGFDADELLAHGYIEPDFKEYDESIEDTVDWNECPECGHKWPQ